MIELIKNYWNDTKNYAKNFHFIAGKLPLANTYSYMSIIIFYLLVILILKEWMKNKKRLNLKYIVAFHNFFLCGLSLIMLVGTLDAIVDIYFKTPKNDKILTLFCDEKHMMTKGLNTFWFYIFYLSKFYELFDTIIIVLKKNQLIFLHVYHHCITIVLVYLMLEQDVAVKWLSVAANCLVHIPMYYYYGMSSLGFQIWWKKYITKLQIIQFIIDVTGIFFFNIF